MNAIRYRMTELCDEYNHLNDEIRFNRTLFERGEENKEEFIEENRSINQRKAEIMEELDYLAEEVNCDFYVAIKSDGKSAIFDTFEEE